MTSFDATRTLPLCLDDRGEVQKFMLTVVEGPNAGESWRSDRGAREGGTGAWRCSVGTHPSNDLVLEDRTVSGFHCEVRSDSRGVRVLDQESKNGTLVSGVRIRDAYLVRGSLLHLGATRLRVDVPGEVHAIALSERARFGVMVGGSATMRSVFNDLEVAARRNVGVLLQGESGTGKELAARAIHMNDPQRRDKPFQVVDCGLLVANLFESELFGHEKGAFNEALQHVGAFESADGGTVFLDEIGNVPLEKQPSLLRVLQEKEIRRVGSNSFRKVDVRIIAATNSDLCAEVNRGRFREDLYYRLAVVRVELPPLRAHPEDIPLLASTLLHDLEASDTQLQALLGDPDFVSRLQRWAWPGNIRELRNYLERCLTFERAVPLDRERQPHSEQPLARAVGCDPRLPYEKAKRVALLAWEEPYLTALVAAHGGDVTKAAVAAGISRAYLYRRLQQHGKSRPSSH